MRNKAQIVLLFLFVTLSSCNIPQIQKNSPDSHQTLLWDLSVTTRPPQSENTVFVEMHSVSATATPQLLSAIDFEEAFHNATQPVHADSPVSIPNGNDSAEWLYFSPAEYSVDPLETLYAVFKNNGSSSWNEDYYLEFYAGKNPSADDRINLNSSVTSGNNASFEIPIRLTDRSWKSCWHLKNSDGAVFFDFCYNHGDGTIVSEAKSVSNNSENDNSSEVYFAFRKTTGTAPAKYSTKEQSAEFISTSPEDGHTFKAYDHNETITASFKNNGSETWDSSYRLVFYNGYNWFHHRSFPLQDTIKSGETAVFTMPMEIIEDNDKWVTCWYLSTPDGKNLSDFCFKYYTRS